jgi:GDPmannose 4,6-dehydratase
MSRRAFITGITGQDGSYLAEYLLGLGYEVHGLVRAQGAGRASANGVQLHAVDLGSYSGVVDVLGQISMDEFYHLAARTFVGATLDAGFSTMNTNINGTHHVLEALRKLHPRCRFFFAASSGMFGKVREMPQRETTPFHPRNAYGISKVAGYYLTLNYREAYGMHASNGILFNHESARRGVEFVSRKISNAVARIKLGLASELYLGNLDAKRDWGHAKDYVRAMHLMLQRPEPGDFVIATGETHSVREFCELAFAEVGLDYRDFVKVDPQFYRSAEVDVLMGDATKARTELGWKPAHTFTELVQEMVQHDLEQTKLLEQSLVGS